MNVGHVVSCADVEPLLPLIADGVIDAAAEPAVFTHLAGCNDCQEALLHHDLVTVALAGAPIPPRRRARVIPWPWAVAAAAGLVAALAVGWPTPAAIPLVAAPQAPAVAAVPMSAPATDTVPVPEIEVLIVPGDRPGADITILRRGDAVVVIEPRPAPESAQPVGFRRY